MKEELNNPIAEIAVEELEDRSTISDDDAALIALGKMPELRRVHGFWSCICPLALRQ